MPGAGLLEFDRLVRADIRTRAALGAIVRTGENSHVLEVESARRALIHADAACGTQIGVDNRLAHGQDPLFRYASLPCGSGLMIATARRSRQSVIERVKIVQEVRIRPIGDDGTCMFTPLGLCALDSQRIGNRRE